MTRRWRTSLEALEGRVTTRREIARIHLDTDIGGDPDDLCGLTMLLGWKGVELVGVTTTIDPDGMRAAYVRYVLGLIHRADIRFEAGAQPSMQRRIRAQA